MATVDNAKSPFRAPEQSSAIIQANCSDWLTRSITFVVKPAYDAFIKEVKYIFIVDGNVRDLETETRAFLGIRDDVDQKIKADRRNGLVAANEEKTWLDRANKAISEEEKNRERYEQRRMIIGSCAPNYWSNYKISKKASKMLGEVKWCRDNRPNGRHVNPPESPPEPLVLIQVESVCLKASQNCIIKDALRYIQGDATVGLIGIWGPRQVGKTLLLKTINNSFHTENSKVYSSSHEVESPFFDFVIYITASEECSVQSIQSKIMRRLNMKDGGPASSKIISGFLRDKSFLVLLDDLRVYVDLAEVGIPALGVHGQLNQKVVITARSQTLCRKMKVNKDINVPGLEMDEALELFKDSAGEENLIYSDPKIRTHMEDLVEILRVLPEELIHFGRDMSGKGHPRQWEDVTCVVKELIKMEDQNATSLRERIVVKLKELMEKLSEKSSDGIHDTMISDGRAICDSEPIDLNWDISIAAAKLIEIAECINNDPQTQHVRNICDLCDSDEHVTKACPLQNGAKTKAEPCGFAVDGLGFYYIPFSGKQKSKLEAKIMAVVNVTKGQMTAAQVTSELKRLLANHDNWKWKVEEIAENSFTTTFPSMADLQRMVLSGPVNAECTKAKMVFEEMNKSEEYKYKIPKVWVQFCGLPKELMEQPIISAVGSILGVTCMVDMEFTNKYDRSRLKVSVLDPELIPDLVKVVVGDYVYKLQFRVENEEDDDNPKLIGMDFEPQEDDNPVKEDKQGKRNDGSAMSSTAAQSVSGSGSVPIKKAAIHPIAGANSVLPIVALHPTGHGTGDKAEGANRP